MRDKVNEFLNIPEKLTIGFRDGYDTFTGKLAYVTYLRDGKIAKVNSWEGWRNKSIDPLDIDNVPTRGFIINKRVGGRNSGWNYRQPYCRIYDPRGFEFEITFDNLVYILQEHGYSPDSGFLCDLVYAWEGQNLVLLPTDSEDYTASKELHAKTTAEDIKAKDLVIGKAYKTKFNDVAYYLGKLDWKLRSTDSTGASRVEHVKISKYHSFLVKAGDNPCYDYDRVVGINSMANILITRNDISQLSNTDVELYKRKFQITVAGNTEMASELKINPVPVGIKQLWEDVVINRSKHLEHVCGAYQESDKKIMIYDVYLTRKYNYDWIKHTSVPTGDPFLEIYGINEITIDNDGVVQRTYYPSPTIKDKLDDKTAAKLVPFSVGGYSNEPSWQVKIGGIWYRGRWDINGDIGRPPEIKIE